jgi:hypothetical protein
VPPSGWQDCRIHVTYLVGAKWGSTSDAKTTDRAKAPLPSKPCQSATRAPVARGRVQPATVKPTARIASIVLGRKSWGISVPNGMARMIPETPLETDSAAERRVFERLRDETSDDLVAFHSVAWLVPGPGGRPKQGESDFVLAHREHGVLCLEVKGGAIRYDATLGKWFSVGREGEAEIKDPIRQAQRGSFLLRDSLARSKRGIKDRIAFGHAVVFPDTRAAGRTLGPNLPRDLVIDHAGLDQLGDRIQSLFRHWRGDKPPLGNEGLRAVESVLANSFTLTAPLAFELEEQERRLLRLTEEQYRILDFLARQPRAAIAGCAGSGKTFLAAEKARRLAAQGFRTLVLAYNVLLARHLRRGLADVATVDVFAFDGLCRAIVEEAGHDIPASPELGNEAEYYGTLRRLFAESVDVAAGRYGALVVDEAQDFDAEWWLPLQYLLEDPDESPLYVFLDDNQKIFPVRSELPVRGEPYQLTVNCRNTKRINALVGSFYEGATIEALGPEGPPLDVHSYQTDQELLQALDENVRRWIEDAEVDPADIALLTPKSATRSVLWRVEALGGVPLTNDPWEPRKILRSSIYRFKGLERMVVAVAELDGARSDALYVGFSRPSVFLSIFCPRDSLHRLPRLVA